jgi:hypothetical protein
VVGALIDFAALLERLAGNPEEGGHMNTSNLRAVEALLRNCHELAFDAREQAREGGDAMLEHRLGALVKALKDELNDARARIAAQLRAAG